MSELANILELFGFLSIDDVTLETLKKSFKTRILEAHPDKGGDADRFDTLLHSYVYLTETIQRISGGRATLQNILSPDELKRSDEIINQFFEEFQHDEFNQQFEKQKKETHGYASWLKSDNEVEPVRINENELHSIFEKTYKGTTSSIVLHPEAMAYVSGTNLGTALIENESCYTSDIFSRPEYTDVYSAYTTDNTIYDKVSFKENKSLDEMIAERNADIVPFDDEELKAIQEFEKKKLDITETYDKGFIINF